MKRILILMTVLCCVSLVQAKSKKAEMKRVYMFGFSASFTDSVAYMTDVQGVDSATILSTGFLADRSLYGVQFDNFLEQHHEVRHNTTVVFFAEKKSKLEKKYLQVRRRYQDGQKLHLDFVGNDLFRFHAEEYIDPATLETEEQPAPQPEKKDKKKSAGRPDGPGPGGMPGGGMPGGGMPGGMMGGMGR